MGSMNTPGHFRNDGYIDATCFGTLELLTSSIPSSVRPSARTPEIVIRPVGFSLASGPPRDVVFRRADGSQAASFRAAPGTWYGADLPSGTYSISMDGSTRPFRKLR